MIKYAIKKLLLRLPGWKIFDIVIAFTMFWVAHHRIPKRNSGLFNDYHFFLKISDVLYSPLRQFVSDKGLVKTHHRGCLMKEMAPETLRIFHSYDKFF